MTDIVVRAAKSADCETIFKWRNDPFIMSRGSQQRAVSADEHRAWFDASLADKDGRLLLIIELSGVPVGLVRFDRDDAVRATISVYLIQAHTGGGLGIAAIRLGCVEARNWGIRQVLACVREDNLAAQKAFLKAGFIETSAAGCTDSHRGFLCRL